jgi:hypothetical protein
VVGRIFKANASPRRCRVALGEPTTCFARSPDWLKMKNPNAPAVKREAEED